MSLTKHFDKTPTSALAPFLAVFEITFNQEKRLVVITPYVSLENNPNRFVVKAGANPEIVELVKDLPVFDLKGIFSKQTRMRPFAGARGRRWWEAPSGLVPKYRRNNVE